MKGSQIEAPNHNLYPLFLNLIERARWGDIIQIPPPGAINQFNSSRPVIVTPRAKNYEIFVHLNISNMCVGRWYKFPVRGRAPKTGWRHYQQQWQPGKSTGK